MFLCAQPSFALRWAMSTLHGNKSSGQSLNERGLDIWKLLNHLLSNMIYSISLTSYNFTIQTLWKWPRSFHLPGTFTPQEYFPNGWLPNLSPASSPSMLLMWWNIFIFCCICVTRWSFLATNCFWCYNLLKEQDRSPLLKAQQLPGDLFSGIKKGFETFHLNFNVIFILKSPNAAKTTKLCNPFWRSKFERNLVWNIFLQFISSQLQTAIIS